uniref:MLO-like protein 14 n=1 Tax=Aegilops tauschii TaxID=37682 RepID=M8BLD7_AEGTA
MRVFCFLAQFGQSVVRADYLILRKGFIKNHNLPPTYDFHTYMTRSKEEEFEKIVGLIYFCFHVFYHLYFWIAILPVAHIIAILTSEGAKLTAFGPRIKPRDDLFWFKKPKFLLWLIHFVLFQVCRTVPLQLQYVACLCACHAANTLLLVRQQMGSKYKAALIPNRIRESMHGWGKDTRKRRKKRRGDDSTIRTETSTVCSLDYEDEDDDGHGHSEMMPRHPGCRHTSRSSCGQCGAAVPFRVRTCGATIFRLAAATGPPAAAPSTRCSSDRARPQPLRHCHCRHRAAMAAAS